MNHEVNPEEWEQERIDLTFLAQGIADSIDDIFDLKPDNRDRLLGAVGPMIGDLYALIHERSMFLPGSDPDTFWD